MGERVDPVRYKGVVAYRGTRFHGWQIQTVGATSTWKGAPPEGGQLRTVQGVMCVVVASVVGHPVVVVGASRTDAGVHAKGQVFHFDTTARQIPREGLRRAINARLPGDVVVRSMEVVPVGRWEAYDEGLWVRGADGVSDLDRPGGPRRVGKVSGLRPDTGETPVTQKAFAGTPGPSDSQGRVADDAGGDVGGGVVGDVGGRWVGGFDAISDAVHKRYQYVVWNREDRNVFLEDLAFHRWQVLDVAAMREAAGKLVGTHDFASFAKPGHGREHTVRTVTGCDVSTRGGLLVIGVSGTGFLWNQVRIMAGTLIEVGLGRFSPGDVAQMLSAKDRRSAGSTAPAHGLYLQWIVHRMQGEKTGGTDSHG